MQSHTLQLITAIAALILWLFVHWTVVTVVSANPSGETRTLPRSSSMAAGLERNGRSRVQAIFSHAAGDNSTLLSFSEGDVITLLVPEARDGWHYGENEKNKMQVPIFSPLFIDLFILSCLHRYCEHVILWLWIIMCHSRWRDSAFRVWGQYDVNHFRRGWFPFSYTRVLPDSDSDKLRVKYVAVLK